MYMDFDDFSSHLSHPSGRQSNWFNYKLMFRLCMTGNNHKNITGPCTKLTSRGQNYRFTAKNDDNYDGCNVNSSRKTEMIIFATENDPRINSLHGAQV
jgi:hypothetical protein